MCTIYDLFALEFRKHDGNPTIYSDPDAEDRYLELEHLGEVLKKLSSELPGMI